LLCYSRYEWENGIEKTKKTTLNPRIDEDEGIYRLFVGKVYQNNAPLKCPNNHDINNYLEEIIIEPHEINSFKEFIYDSIDKNIEKLNRQNAYTTIDIDHRNYIEKFMRETNTTAYDLFTVNGKKHCNHFFGFPIKDKSGNIWGIVTIDILDESNDNIYTILRKPHDDQWLDYLFKSYSNIYGKIIDKF
jgi:hypothetical protein